MTWPRPVPLVGDTTSAAQRADDPRAWRFGEDQRRALYEIIAARRDIRRFRPDPVEPALVERLMSSAHAGPSVGHCQSWRFLLVASPVTRERAALIAERERQRQARLLTEDARRRMLDLQLDGIREAPLGVVVCCDRRTAAAGVLGRATFPDTDMWSCACAIENLWLAARAEGLGVGWVTLFPPDELARLVALPAGVETLGWLCVGWPDERLPGPGLERAGWSRRAPLDEVVLHERWPDASPRPPASALRAPDAASVIRARDQADQLLTPPGSLGVLDKALDRLGALGITTVEKGTLVLVAADHPVTGFGVSTYPSTVTREVLEATVAGQSLGAAAARAARMSVVAVDAGVSAGDPDVGGPGAGVGSGGPGAGGRGAGGPGAGVGAGGPGAVGPGAGGPGAGGPGGGVVTGALNFRPVGRRGDLVTEDAMSLMDVDRLLERGRQLGQGLDGQLVALGEVGVGNTTVAAALSALLTGLSAVETVGLGSGADSATLERKRLAVEAALWRVGLFLGPTADPQHILAAVGGPEFVVLAGVVLGSAQRGAAVVLDGLATSVAALCAVRLEPGAAAHLIAGQRSREKAHTAVLEELGLEPLLDLRMRAGEGVGAVLSSRLLSTGLQLRSFAGRVTP